MTLNRTRKRLWWAFWLLASLVLPPLIADAQMPPADEAEALRINTAGWTDSPFLTPDGRYLYFMYTPYNFFPWLLQTGEIEKRGPDRAGHHPHPLGIPWGDSDVYRVERLPEGGWGPPENLPFNDSAADACPMVTADGRTVYWQKDRSGNAELYVAYLDDAGEWSEGQPLPAPVNLPDSHETNPHISEDEQVLYFTSDRVGGFGGSDLYVTYRLDDGTWSEPENLGPTFNTEAGEDQFWLSQDGQTAYFNRDLTILVTQQTEDGWSQPEVVTFAGGPVLAAEVSITADGQRLVLAMPDIPAERLVLAEAVRLPDGRWSEPIPLD